ncbi:MAG: hypothetical protein M0T81_07295 [Thermoplasmatales archaeon]|jgi:class 3 adenylate cyclase|nr:hypothetical protein [Thermoplasmatales archaeon]
MDEILDTTDSEYKEVSNIPSRSQLSYANGFYVSCSALFVDIRKSSDLTDYHRNKVLSRIYRAYVSEAVALMNGNSDCVEINVVGDGVSGIFNTPYRENINTVFGTAFQISSLIDILNCRLKARNMKTLTVGIGASYGSALMIMAGYKGSGINEVVWVGDVVNEASNLSEFGNKTEQDCEIMVSNIFYDNLNDTNKKFLTKHPNRQCYHGNIISISMNDWLKSNCP